jgi:hypothetical protein
MLLNAIVPTFTNDTFNMFFISWKYPCTLPVLSDIYPKVPYIIFLLIYIVGFAIAGFIIYNIIYWITWLVDRQKPKPVDKFDYSVVE